MPTTTIIITVFCYVVSVLDTKDYSKLILNVEICVCYPDNRQNNNNLTYHLSMSEVIG